MPADYDAPLQELQLKLERFTAERNTHALDNRKIDEKLRILLKNAPKRPKMTKDQIDTEMSTLEKKRTTTSMSLSNEKCILRDLQSLKEKKNHLQEWNAFQNLLNSHKQQRAVEQERLTHCEKQMRALSSYIEKLVFASSLGLTCADLKTAEVLVSQEKLGIFIYEQGSVLQKIKKKHHVLAELDRDTGLIKVTSSQENVQAAVKEIRDIDSATPHSIGLHPDALNLLLFQKGKYLHALQEQIGAKLHVNKIQGTLTLTASLEKVQILEKAIHDLNQHCVELDIPVEVIPRLVGIKGVTINQLMLDTGALVRIDSISKSARICGSVDAVVEAERRVNEIIKEHSRHDVVYSTEDSDLFKSPDFVSYKFALFIDYLLMDEAKHLQLLRKKAKGVRINLARKERKIYVSSTRVQLHTAEEALLQSLHDFESQHWAYRVSDTSILSHVIGKRGSMIKKIEESCDNLVRIEIRSNYICIWGDPDKIVSAKLQVLEIVENGMRSAFHTSPHVASLLLSKKRALLNDIEQSTGCRLSLYYDSGEASAKPQDKQKSIKISLQGSFKSIRLSKERLEVFEQQNRIRYVPLDEDNVAVIIGRKGETILQIAKDTGARIRFIQGDRSIGGSELELLGNEEQLFAAEKLISEKCKTSNQHVIQLDEVSMRCLLADCEKALNVLRKTFPGAAIDVFQRRDQIRVTGDSQHSLQSCVHAIFKYLQGTVTLESITVPSANDDFYDILSQHPFIALRLQELEAMGDCDAHFVLKNDGKIAEIEGPALGIIRLRNYLQMLASTDVRYAESIKLPAPLFASVLLFESANPFDVVSRCTLNEHAQRISQETGCELRLKLREKFGAEIFIEGNQLIQVYEAKKQVGMLLQQVYPKCIEILANVPRGILPRLYKLANELSYKDQISLSLVGPFALRIFSDSEAHTQHVTQLFAQEIRAWRDRIAELCIPGWLVSILLRKGTEVLKTIAAQVKDTRLEFMRASGSGFCGKHIKEDRLLIVSGPNKSSIMAAVEAVHRFLEEHRSKTSLLAVGTEYVTLALSLRRELKSCQLHVIPHEDPKQLNISIYGIESHRQQALKRLHTLLEGSCVDHVSLNGLEKLSRAVIESELLINGVPPKAGQRKFPNVLLEFEHSRKQLAIKGPRQEVHNAKVVMENKIRELMHLEMSCDLTKTPNDDASKAAITHTAENISGATGDTQASSPPVVGYGQQDQIRLTKNQRRRMRRRAEKDMMDDQSTKLSIKT